MKSHRQKSLLAALVLLAAITMACGGGGGSSGSNAPGDMILVDTDVGESDGVPLNRILTFEFSRNADPDTVRADTIRIREGPNYGKQVPGTYEVDGNTVRFFPRLPVLPDLSDAGLKPGTDYRVTLPGTPDVAVVRSNRNKRLRRETEANFSTGGIAGTLFEDNFLDPAPPRVDFVNPAAGATDVPTDTEIALTFNRRPLHPATVTITNVHLTLVERDGFTFERAVAGRPVLEQSHDSVRVVWEPTFPLADRATYRLVVERRTQDLVGNDLERFESTFTTKDEPPRPGEVLVEFTLAEREELADADVTTASWGEEVDDALAALFTAAGGDGTAGDFVPVESTTVSAEDFPGGVAVQTIGGVETDVLNFRRLEIPEGVEVTFEPRPDGPNRPLMLVALKDIVVNGVLTVEGGDGGDGETNSRNSSIPSVEGGRAGPGGTAGADNYTGSLTRTAPTMDAEDVDLGGGGGRGGGVSSHSNYSYSGGGGGGGSREPGVDGTAGGYPTTSWNGAGGKGGLSEEDRSHGGNEERVPNVGGAGAGAGGLGFYWPTSTNWRHGAGSGGGGGGAITIQSAGDVNIGSTGVIRASGGDGGDSAANSFYYGGAGGGGAGGSVLVRATGTLRLQPGASLDVAGGAGGAYAGTFSRYKGGEGGAGGNGWIRVEAREDENSPGQPLIDGLSSADLTYAEVSEGLFSPRGGGAPSIGQTVWINLGVFNPEMLKPAREDILSTLYNDSMTIEVQMAIEDANLLGNPDLSALDVADENGNGRSDDSLDEEELSQWTRVQEIETLNGKGFQFLRIRVTFQLDETHGPDDPLPTLDRLRIPYRF